MLPCPPACQKDFFDKLASAGTRPADVWIACLLHDHAGDVRVRALVPVEEALHIDHVADLQRFNRLIDVGIAAAEVILHAEIVGLAIIGDLEIQVVGLVRLVL